MGWSNLREQVARVYRELKESEEVISEKDRQSERQLFQALHQAGEHAIQKIMHGSPDAPVAHKTTPKAQQTAKSQSQASPSNGAPPPKEQTSAPPLPGTERPVGNEKYLEIDGQPYLFTHGDKVAVQPDDVRQGKSGDCWLMAAMAAVARANPDAITELIKPLGKNRYEVTLFIGPVDPKTHLPAPVHVVVDNTFPTDDGHNAMYARPHQRSADNYYELWPLLIEKAMAVEWHGYKGEHFLNHGIEGRSHSALDILQGKGKVERTFTLGHSEDYLLAKMDDALATHRPITTNSMMPFPWIKQHGVDTNHVYAVAAVDRHARTVTVQDPRGDQYAPITLPIADYVICFSLIEIGPPLR